MNQDDVNKYEHVTSDHLRTTKKIKSTIGTEEKDSRQFHGV